jgi:hypothetical protein
VYTGNRAAERIRVNLQLPRIEVNAAPGPSDSVGQIGDSGKSHLYADRDAPCRYWNHILGPADPGTSYTTEAKAIRLAGPLPSFPVVLIADHEDMPGGTLVLRWQITLPTRGNEGVVIAGPEQVVPTAPERRQTTLASRSARGQVPVQRGPEPSPSSISVARWRPSSAR